jgi:hypothetical protein
MVWVHHTGFGNQYTCADSPSIIRGIMGNDVNEGFDDLGYNFLVDKCGTLFEGRKGGVDKAVVGAHTIGFNTGSVGVALLGDYTTIRPTDAALKTIATVSRARLTAYGFDPSTTADMVEGVDGLKWPKGTTVTFPRIAGHKDGWQNATGPLTDCPGALMYPLLGVIRGKATLPGLAVKNVTGTVYNGATYVRNTATVNWTVSADAFGISRFDILRDGAAAATADGTARSGSVTLTPGAHSVAVRAVHTSGLTDTTTTVKVFSDVTPPTVTTPTLALRTGTYSATSVPVTVGLKATDNVKVNVLAATSTSPTAATLATTATAWNTAVKPNAALTYTVTAKDVSGNARAVAASKKITFFPDTSAGRTGTWAARVSSSYLGSRAWSSAAKNAKISYTFNGTNAALSFARATTTGVAYVYVDGVKVATIDTKGTSTTYRQTLFVRALAKKVHTVSVVVAGTAGRPTVIVDGLTYVS